MKEERDFVVSLTIAAAACLAVGLVGCDRPDPSTTTTVRTNKSPQVAEATPEQAAMLREFATPLSEGDKAWQEVMKAMREPTIPPHWETNAPTKEEIAQFEKQAGQLAANVAEKVRDFYQRFPEHTNAVAAREQEYQLLSLSAQLGDTNSAARVTDLENAQLKDPRLSEDDRLEIRLQQLQRTVLAPRNAGGDVSVAELEAGARQLHKEFPKRPEVQTLLLSAAQGWLDEGDLKKSRDLVGELKASESAEIKDAAEQLSRKLERIGKPLEMKFSSLDGRAVDLQAMKGKVVLVDFWATWCRPCLAELPNVKAAYERLHKQGFEIVGVSLDSDKSALERMLAKETMTWPQYFGEGATQLAEDLGITGIPAMWLVDRKGVLRDLNARSSLAEKVEKLLAEPAE